MTRIVGKDVVAQSIVTSDRVERAAPTAGAEPLVSAASGDDQPVAANFTGTGGSDSITGTNGDDTIDGGAGADTMTGLGGNDTYYVDNKNDIVVEASGGGTDTVQASVDYSLSDFVENLILAGAAIKGIGNGLNNTVTGNANANALYGGAGADTLIGGLGNDTYYVENAGDVVTEAAAAGNDTVSSSVGFTLGANVERLVLTGAAAINGTGNALANTLTGNGAANILDGGTGADVMKGGGGNDTYYVENAGDKIEEVGGNGTDTAFASVDYSIADQAVENLTLTGTAVKATGNGLANTLIGNSAGNVLIGGSGGDTMIGGLGNDIYYVDHAGDVVTEVAGEGTDTVRSAISYTLGATLENLALVQTGAVNGTGNASVNTLLGNANNNILDGAAGADTMKGGAGNDTYVVDNAGDSIVELDGEGSDTVQASVSFTLGGYLETLTLTGTGALAGNGNALANTINGNSGANVLNGGSGADTLKGGAGNDTYVVDNAGDVVVENNGAGTDTVNAAVSYALSQYVENLVLTGSGVTDGTGNTLANALTGNAAKNVLDGGVGNDTMTGGGGIDYFSFSTALGVGNVDTVTDFDPSQDFIRLVSGLGNPFQALAAGQPLPANAFATGSVATTAETRILYDSATGALRYDGDGVGGAAAVQFATLATGLALGASDFVVGGPANHAPTISSSATATIAEQSAASTIVYQTVANDSDGDALTYRLTGPDAALLGIDTVGAVRLLQSPDFETKSSYSFNVGVKDAQGAETLRTVTLSITDVAETGPTPSANETSGANDSIAQAQILSRNSLASSSNPNLPDDSLPSIVIEGNVATATDKDFFAITLEAGEALILDVDNSSGNLDAYLTAYGPSGIEIGSNDDLVTLDAGSDAHPEYGHNTDSFLRFRATSDGTYYFSIQAFNDPENPTLGSYQLNVSIGPVATPEQIMQEDVQALLSGYSWDHNALSYSFPTSASQYPAGIAETDEAGEFAPFTATQQAATTQVLALYALVSGLTFTQNTASPGSAELRFAMSSEADTAYAYYPTGTALGGSAWFNQVDYNNPIRGNYAWTSVLHETGHALGLKHGHEAPAVSYGHDSFEYTVMTYRSYAGADVSGGYANEDFGFPQTLMMLDIAAIQQMHGANFNTASGNSVYSWSPTTGQMSINGAGQGAPGANRVFLTVWDGGGTDTYDMSNYSTSVRIDLRPGEWSLTSFAQRANLGDGHFAVGNVANALLYGGDTRSLIENAIGGSANDDLTANQAANALTGNGSGDAFYWRSAADAGVGALADTVTDFHSAENDRISFAYLDLYPATGGHESLTFIGNQAFHNVAGEVRYDVSGGSAHVFVDTDGNGVANMEIILTGVTSLSSGDFVL